MLRVFINLKNNEGIDGAGAARAACAKLYLRNSVFVGKIVRYFLIALR